MAITDSAPLFAMGCALVGILAGIILAGWVIRQPQGSERMRSIAGYIQEGASAYLNRQYRTVAIVAIVITIVLFLYKINQGSEAWQYPLAFLVMGLIRHARYGRYRLEYTVGRHGHL